MAERVEAHLANIDRAFEAVIKAAVQRGDIQCDDPRGLARYLNTILQGLSVMAQGPSSRRQMSDLVRFALAPLG